MAARLEGFAAAHQIAMNMDAMAKAGALELLRDGSEFQSETKKYRLPGLPHGGVGAHLDPVGCRR
jgi:hypothetical protein